MKLIKRVFSQLYLFLIWIILSTMIWGWVFNLITDTSADKKITVFVEVDEMKELELTLELEKDMPEGIKMIKVHPFSYALLDSNTLLGSDVFIVKASNIAQYAPDFALPPEGALPEGEVYYIDGAAYGVKVYDVKSGEGIAAEYITYADEDMYLFYGAGSTHLGDGKAEYTVRKLFELQGGAR